MTYTIETLRTVAGERYYIRCQGRLMRGGFANYAAAVKRIERIKFFEALDQARGQMNYADPWKRRSA